MSSVTTSPVKHSQPSPKFGWNKDTVHVERIKLSKGDMDKDGTPTDSFVRNVAPFLDRESSDNPGFVVLENTLPELKKKKKFVRCISNLLLSVLPEGEEKFSTVPKYMEGLDNMFSWTVKELHWDHRDWQLPEQPHLLSIRYGPYCAIEQGGYPILADPVALQQDTGVDVSEMRQGVYGLKDEYRRLLLENYSHTFSELDFEHDAPVLIWSNQYPSGLVHGATQPKAGAVKLWQKQPSRPLVQVSAGLYK